MQQINDFSDIEELSIWITGVMHRFIQHSFDFAQIKHSDVVFKTMEYIRQNYDHKMSLDDIAQHVYLSRSYLSSLFREETGQTLFFYINQVRVEKSKLFLMDPSFSLAEAAALCGFEDQSYFTKVFRKHTGLSPKQYRDRMNVK
jgi:YesN/AraC family two-component response regulator